MSRPPFEPPYTGAPRTPMLPAWRHVLAMSDAIGIFEHADHADPRREEGYCTDDVARLLIAIVREPVAGQELHELARVCFRYLVDAQGVTAGASATDAASMGAGTAAAVSTIAGVAASGHSAPPPTSLLTTDCGRARCRTSVMPSGSDRRIGGQWRSPRLVHRRSWRSIRATYGRGSSLPTRSSRSARSVLTDPGRGPNRECPTPMRRSRRRSSSQAIGWSAPRFSPTDWNCCGGCSTAKSSTVTCQPYPSAVRGPTTSHPGSTNNRSRSRRSPTHAPTQELTGDSEWGRGVDLAIDWFAGDNDLGAPMSDPITGGGYDGLTPSGPNLNQGAESTLALISTMQYSRTRGALEAAVGR